MAEKEYPPAWGPSPGGLWIDHNHVPREAYAKAMEKVLGALDKCRQLSEAAREVFPYAKTKDNATPKWNAEMDRLITNNLALLTELTNLLDDGQQNVFNEGKTE